MGMYLNSISPYYLYKSEFSRPYFVDKSEVLKELIPFVFQGNSYICVTRPRRFGKTVMANMIGAFFGKGEDASEIFDNLKISQEENYRNHLNQHNVIYIDFSVVDDECTSYKEYIEAIKETLKSDLHLAYPDVAFREKSSVREDLTRIFTEKKERTEKKVFYKNEFLHKQNLQKYIL